MSYEEYRLQCAIVEYLELRGIFCHSIPNERKSSPQAGARLKRSGRKAGVADLVLWIPHNRGVRICYVEVKTPKGRQSDSQKEFEQNCELAGVPYRLVRSVKDVQELLNSEFS